VRRATCVVLCGVRRAACGATCAVRCAWCDVRGAVCLVRRARCGVPGATCVVRCAWCGARGAMCGVGRDIVDSRKRTGPGGPPGLQNRSLRAFRARAGFDSQALPPLDSPPVYAVGPLGTGSDLRSSCGSGSLRHCTVRIGPALGPTQRTLHGTRALRTARRTVHPARRRSRTTHRARTPHCAPRTALRTPHAAPRTASAAAPFPASMCPDVYIQRPADSRRVEWPMSRVEE
jgi:hypothetical protein